MNKHRANVNVAYLPFFQPVSRALVPLMQRMWVPLICTCLALWPAFASAKEATTSEAFAINLWTHTCLVAYGKREKLERILNRGSNLSRLDEDAARQELKGKKGLAWAVQSSEFGRFIIMRWETGECLIATDKSDARNAQNYFDTIVGKAIPDEWQISKQRKDLSEYSERVTYRIVSAAGRKIEFEIITSTKTGGRQLVIYTKFQQPGEIWLDW
jgi:hypothetical protein